MEIFLTSFLIIFLELALIRVFPAQVAFLGFYSNFILIGSFAGIGIGLLLSKYKFDLRKVFPWMLFLTTIILSLQIKIFPNFDGKQELFRPLDLVSEVIMVPLIILVVIALMASLSQRLGLLFNQFKPLIAYKWDVAGSIVGVILFAVLSYLRTDPLIWFSLISILFIYLNRKEKDIKKDIAVFSVSFFILFIAIYKDSGDIIWSPYQKLSVITQSEKFQLLANNIEHQSVYKDLAKLEPSIYTFVYDVLEKPTYENALIIGSGMGTDIAMALKHSVKHIDAVEIDPGIYEMGLKYNPDKAYQNPSVSFFNADGRSFLARSVKKYDLIVYALPDTLFLSGSRGNLRIESFLFTKESFEMAKKRLTPDGVVVLYNLYNQPFVVDKLVYSLNSLFGQETYLQQGGSPTYTTAMINGNQPLKLKKNIKTSDVSGDTTSLITDDWPFLYMQKRHIPFRYLEVLLLVFTLIYLLIVKIVKKPFIEFINLNYFFLGVGFFLIETKSIVQFSLLFGATWITNTLVISAILISVFLATIVAAKNKMLPLKMLYGVLFLGLGVQYFLPLNKLLSLNSELRYLLVSLITFIPVFTANVIFSLTFKSSKNNSLNFASNMFGAVVGGGLEYLALITGYRNLVLIIALCYFLALISPKKTSNFSFKKNLLSKF